MREYLPLHMTALLAGALLDFIIGDPHALPHPVRLIGKLISVLENVLYREESGRRRLVFSGFVLWLTVILAVGLSTFLIMYAALRVSLYLFAVIEIGRAHV